ncbi:hypothetical protein [Phytohabitans rumicis]|uniref:Uncharacterized protein n=1 Tax=Phytohabitans rumicis TaxID=1076125 RepID=A0A6V8LQE1_9ACTN|nr:hypothetical protein [Phytohabitans rumicis]GFJ94915.1 hypothetical protein Prum_085570 [Phytohabitans rumicis]
MTDTAWPTVSCWLAAELTGTRDKRPAILGDFLALAQDGFLDVIAKADMYTLRRTEEVPPGLPFERAELLAGLFFSLEATLLRPSARSAMTDSWADRIGLDDLRKATQRSAAELGLTRRLPLPGLTAAGKAERRRLQELPARLDTAHGDPRAVPWARLLLDDDKFRHWYGTHVLQTGLPAWLVLGDGLPDSFDLLGPLGIGGLFEALLHQVVPRRPKMAPSRERDYIVSYAPAPAAQPAAPAADEDDVDPADLLGPPLLTAERFLRARAAAGPDAAAGVTDVAAARDLLSRLRESGDASAIADADERLLALERIGSTEYEPDWPTQVIARRQELAGSDPQRHGPLLGLALALHAHLLLDADLTDAASAEAEHAIAVLTRHLSRAGRIQPALVLAQDAAAITALESGRPAEAERVLTRSTEILRRLTADDPGHADDLAHHEALLTDEALPLIAGPAIVQLDRQLDEGIQLSRAGRLAEAEPLLADAMAKSTLLIDPDLRPDKATGWDRALLCRSGKAHWRYVIAAHARGHAAEALDAGQRAIWCYQTAKDLAPAGSAELAEVTAQLMTVLADVAEIANGTGDAGMSTVLTDEGIRLGRLDTAADQAIQRALGTLLHNKANAMTNAVVHSAQAGTPLPYTGPQLGGTIADAVTIRESLAHVDGLAVWELTNSLLLGAHIAALVQNPRAAVELFCRAGALLAGLGTAADSLANRQRQIGDMLAAVAPQQVAAARSAGRWPLP